MNAVGVAIGSQVLKVVVGDGEPVEVPMSSVGAKKIVDFALEHGVGTVLFVGNRKWAEAMAATLQATGLECRYLGGPGASRGERFDLVKVLRAAFARGDRGQAYFGNRESFQPQEDENNQPWIMLANDYHKLNDDIRTAKHHVLDALRTLFPELLTLEEKLWGKKAVDALRGEQWDFFQKYELAYSESLGRHCVVARQAEARRALREAIADLDTVLVRKGEKEDEVADVFVSGHPVLAAYNNTFTAMLVTLLVGWKNWGTVKRDWRRLRAYAGFAVTKVDGKGRARINRARPQILVHLYHLLKTGRSKAVLEAVGKRLENERAAIVTALKVVLERESGREAIPRLIDCLADAEAMRGTEMNYAVAKVYRDARKQCREGLATYLLPFLFDQRERGIVKQAMERLHKDKMRLVERLEYILKDVWRLLAQPKVVPTPEPVAVETRSNGD